MEGLIREKLIDHLTSNNLISECQHGFISGRLCSTNLLAIMAEALEEGKLIDTWTMPRLLIQSPINVSYINCMVLGVQGKVLNWILVPSFLYECTHAGSYHGR